jgi:hypothetical protein
VKTNLRSRVVFAEDTGAAIYNVVGYGLLGTFLCMLAEVLITAGFTVPAWEFEAARRLTDSSWAFVFGAALVLRRTRGQISLALEANLMKWVTRICLAGAIGYILLMMVAWNASARLGQADSVQTERAMVRIHEQAKSMAREGLHEQAGAIQRIRAQERSTTEALARDFRTRQSSRSWLAARIMAHSLIIALLCFGLVRINAD